MAWSHSYGSFGASMSTTLVADSSGSSPSLCLKVPVTTTHLVKRRRVAAGAHHANDDGRRIGCAACDLVAGELEAATFAGGDESPQLHEQQPANPDGVVILVAQDIDAFVDAFTASGATGIAVPTLNRIVAKP